MPINREDGRHWCDPASEEPDAEGQWTCPDCKTVWLYTEDPGHPLWETAEQRDGRLHDAPTMVVAEDEETD